ncbi:hypothetical protein [Novosphingobium sp.]|uniref:hypothetical protein n=1 Tax=Novosphingobium sp. TaxID=1874826 RepID=UPI0025EC642E|nr:hypothetical protein [Novosphingobium sp.]MCC6926533.1 hypothetical protein [Novosphingobium sp.]
MIQQNPKDWSQGFWGSEHPETAALRVQKDYVDTMISLKRENMDRIYAYINTLIEKAKEELGHARSGGSSGDHRRMALKQHVDEIAAYLKGQALDVQLPNTYGERGGANLGHHYVLEDVPAFFGRVKCVIDQWYDSHLLAVYDEVVILVKPKGQTVAGTSNSVS